MFRWIERLRLLGLQRQREKQQEAAAGASKGGSDYSAPPPLPSKYDTPPSTFSEQIETWAATTIGETEVAMEHEADRRRHHTLAALEDGDVRDSKKSRVIINGVAHPATEGAVDTVASSAERRPTESRDAGAAGPSCPAKMLVD